MEKSKSKIILEDNKNNFSLNKCDSIKLNI